MDKFCYENFYFIQTAIGLVAIGLVVGNCVCWSRRAEHMHKVITEVSKVNKLTFDWSSANTKIKALHSKATNK